MARGTAGSGPGQEEVALTWAIYARGARETLSREIWRFLMNTSSRGAVIATVILAGTLCLASFVVMSGLAVGRRSPAPTANFTATAALSPG